MVFRISPNPHEVAQFPIVFPALAWRHVDFGLMMKPNGPHQYAMPTAFKTSKQVKKIAQNDNMILLLKVG
jgi:hypothetical protein